MRADIVGGPVRAVADTPIGAAIAIATSTPYGVGGARHHYLTEPAYVDTVFMGVARRETWLRYPFNEEFVRNQDDELSYRLLDAGGRIVCDPAIESFYRSRSTLGSLWRQYFDYGCWKVRVLQAHPRQARVRHLVPLALVDHARRRCHPGRHLKEGSGLDDTDAHVVRGGNRRCGNPLR